jgi:hypothetical protein
MTHGGSMGAEYILQILFCEKLQNCSTASEDIEKIST